MSGGAILILCAQAWLLLGSATAVAFLGFGIDRIEERARGAYAFRPLLVPGILLLWPLVIARWAQREQHGPTFVRSDRPLREAHAIVWMVLAVLLPAIVMTALAIRQTTPDGQGAIQLEMAGERPR